MKRQLGKITSAEIMIEDHGLLTFFAQLDFGSSGQGFGGYVLDQWDEEKKRRVGTAMGCDFILKYLQLFNVQKLVDTVGRSVYALREGSDWGPILGIQVPEFDGGKTLLLSEWRNEWGVIIE